MSRRRIVSRHLLRRTARARAHRLERLQLFARTAQFNTTAELRSLGVGPHDRVWVERAGRIRARWIVVSGA